MTSASAVTFLFTDIEGSTRLWETHPTLMASALERHDRLCRASVEAQSGRVVKMIGDGLHAVFDDPASAVAVVLELQRGIFAIAADHDIPLRARCGLHAGVSQLRDGDYFGSAVNRAARIMNAAHGGQVLLSQTVVDLLKGRLADGTHLMSLGRVRLRDLSDPEDLWQLMHADLVSVFPSLRSLDSTPNNLPQQLTSFIGREREIADVQRLLVATRMVTLVGAGGCGKTRLSLQVAADLLDHHPDGVWLVELAPLSDPGLVPQTLATVLGLKEQPGKSFTLTVIEYLTSKQMLLILDNAEHVLAACAELAAELLQACPQIVLLVSSRERRAIESEHTFRVPSLSTPDPQRDRTPESLTPYESVRLFTERAQLNLPRFAVTSDNAPALASLCHRLDGIPLALELAAARVRSMTVQEINQRLSNRFRVVTGGSRRSPRRQQTLRALIDWSYDLLNDGEKGLLCRASTFSGGWTLGAAEEVTVGNGVEAWEVLDLLTALADKSLIVAEERQGATRYRLLETVRDYSRERLRERDETATCQDRHLAHFVSVAEDAEPHLSGSDQRIWLDRLETEHDNLRTALAWSSVEGGDALSGLRLAGTMWRFWSVRGYLGEGRSWLNGLLDRTRGANVAARAKALNVAASLAWRQSDYPTAKAFNEEALSIQRQLGDRRGIAKALNNFANLATEQGEYAIARPLYEESLAIRQELGEREDIAISLNNLAILTQYQGDLSKALELYQESLTLRRELGDRWGVASSLSNVGAAFYHQGNHSSARRLFEESLAIRRELSDREGIAHSLSNLGSIALEQGDCAAARGPLEESLAIFRQLGDRWRIASTLCTLGLVACDSDDIPLAETLHKEGLSIRRDLGDRRGIAISLEGFACLATALPSPGRAARIWGVAERLREEIGAPVTPSERPRHDRQVAAARAARSTSRRSTMLGKKAER